LRIGREVIRRLIRVVEVRRTPVTRVVARARALDLDHVGAEVGEQLGGPGTGEDAREIEDAEVRERGGHDEKIGTGTRDGGRVVDEALMDGGYHVTAAGRIARR
jgi:hypothetical protein